MNETVRTGLSISVEERVLGPAEIRFQLIYGKDEAGYEFWQFRRLDARLRQRLQQSPHSYNGFAVWKN